MEDWKLHFCQLLKGKIKKEEEPKEKESRKKANEDEEEDITAEEVINVIKKLKKNKAPGENGIKK